MDDDHSGRYADRAVTEHCRRPGRLGSALSQEEEAECGLQQACRHLGPLGQQLQLQLR